jgi:hypothetical protein
MVINPTDYMAHTTLRDVIYIPAQTPEALASAIRYTQLRHVTQKDLEFLSRGLRGWLLRRLL